MPLLSLLALAQPVVAAAGPVECVVTTDCGCPSDGVTAATACLRRCIADCHHRGPAASRVVVPAGRYVTGALNLTSHLVLQLDAGAELLGSLEPSDYPLVAALPGYGITRDGGVPADHLGVRHQALISGWNTTGAVIEGQGTINGRGHVLAADGKSFYTRAKAYGRPRLVEPMVRGTPPCCASAWAWLTVCCGHRQFCEDFRIENVQLQNSAFWTLHPCAATIPCPHPTPPGPHTTLRGARWWQTPVTAW